MPLDDKYREFVRNQLDECDAALVDKPFLAQIFDETWRQAHREQMLNANSRVDVWYPSAYAKPHQDFDYPRDYQQRLEEGAAILVPRLDDGERNHLTRRMQGDGCLSAEEELLLARGFAIVFGREAISFPTVPRGQDVPEFHVDVDGHTIEVEAKGLTDQQEVWELNKLALRSAQASWSSFSQSIGDVSRLRAAVARKLLTNVTGDARVLALTQYTVWIDRVEGVPLMRAIATDPGAFQIPDDKHALGIAYVTRRWLTGVWFNLAVVKRLGLSAQDREAIRRALKLSFYECQGGVFFNELQSEAEEEAMIAKMIRISHGSTE